MSVITILEIIQLSWLSKCLNKYSAFCASSVAEHADQLLSFLKTNLPTEQSVASDYQSDILVTTHSSMISNIGYQLNVVAALFRAYHQLGSAQRDEKFASQVQDLIATLSLQKKYWAIYRIGKESLLLGFHEIADKILEYVQDKVEDEFNHLWIVALITWSKAEYAIHHADEQQNVDAMKLLNKAHQYFKV